jgi:DNA polymerase-3 subunit beta
VEFTIIREQLLKPLQRVAGAVERKHTQPILANILLNVRSQLLSLTATDSEVEMVARIPLQSSSVEGATTIPGKKLIDICRALPEKSKIDVTCSDKKVLIKCGKSRYTLATMKAEDFPNIIGSPGDVEISVAQDTLRKLIDTTSFAMAQQDVRYYLNGVLLTFFPNSVRLVATDGHRLATRAIPSTYHIEEPVSMIVPRKAVLEMQRLFAEGSEEVGLVIGKNHLRAITTNYSFITKLIEGRFPDFRRVLPKDGEGFDVILPRDLFRQALIRVSALFSDKNRGVGLKFYPGIMKIVGVSADKDEVEDEIEVNYDGAEMEIGINVSYLIEYLGVIKADTLCMRVINPNSSVLFHIPKDIDNKGNFGHNYVVMPMRL